jgi:hypothetical protein
MAMEVRIMGLSDMILKMKSPVAAHIGQNWWYF